MKSKIISLSDLTSILPKLKKLNKVTILATGVFDFLHQEHKKFLNQAKKQGDILLVGLESDQRVSQLKGKNRPLNNLQARLKNLAKWGIADYIFPLPQKFNTSKDHQKLISQLRPHILAVSSNTPNLPAKRQLIEKYNGKIKIVLKHNPNISTTKIIKTK